jgi:hypothetical protein
VARHDKTTQGRIWTTLQVCEARSRTCSYAGVSRHGVRLLSEGRTLYRQIVRGHRRFCSRVNETNHITFPASHPQPLRKLHLDLVQPTLRMKVTFLHLPPEIRNLIYRFTLGYLHLHVSRKRLRGRVCGDPISYQRRAEEIKRSCGDGHSITPWSPHDYCYEKEAHGERKRQRMHIQKNGMTLGLLSTCRQVHNEAALVPFALNTFIFDTCDTFGNFLAVLKPVQAKEIRSVILESITAGTIGPETITAVSGLKHVCIFGLFFSLSLGRRYNKTGFHNVLSFECIPLRSIRVCFEFLSLEGLRSPMDLRSLETELERLVLSSHPEDLYSEDTRDTRLLTTESE